MSLGRSDRKKRITEGYSGVWASSSQDFVHLARMLYKLSADYARETDNNCSIYTAAGIPMLLSALRCLLIELNSDMYSNVKILCLDDLANSANDIKLVINNYDLSDSLKEDLMVFVELRNEIIHPSHKPTDTNNNTPSYLSSIRDKGLLQSTGEASDYVWISQLQSHRLFEWSFGRIADTVKLLLCKHKVQEDISKGIYESYIKYQRVVL